MFLCESADLLDRTTQYQRLSGKMCSCGNALSLAYHCFCVEQHEAVKADLKYKLKNILRRN